MYRHSPDTRGVVPDVVAGQAGELAAPAAGQRQAAQDGQRLIAAVQRAVETLVAVAPDAVDRADTVWFA